MPNESSGNHFLPSRGIYLKSSWLSRPAQLSNVLRLFPHIPSSRTARSCPDPCKQGNHPVHVLHQYVSFSLSFRWWRLNRGPLAYLTHAPWPSLPRRTPLNRHTRFSAVWRKMSGAHNKLFSLLWRASSSGMYPLLFCLTVLPSCLSICTSYRRTQIIIESHVPPEISIFFFFQVRSVFAMSFAGLWFRDLGGLFSSTLCMRNNHGCSFILRRWVSFTKSFSGRFTLLTFAPVGSLKRVCLLTVAYQGVEGRHWLLWRSPE